jgi:CheY-like chemotaxis protein
VGFDVLVVDDSAPCADFARLLLERQGVRVVGVASTSAEAVELAAALRPDVVLVDLMLGNESGLDLARLLAPHGTDKVPAIIIISAYSSVDVADLLATSPVAGFLPKSELSADAIQRIIGGGHIPGGGSLAVKNR